MQSDLMLARKHLRERQLELSASAIFERIYRSALGRGLQSA
jgi:hypothetical protein